MFNLCNAFSKLIFKTLNINFTNKVQLWHYYKVSNLVFALNFGCLLESRYSTVLCKSIENKTYMHTFRSCMWPRVNTSSSKSLLQGGFYDIGVLQLLLNVIRKHFSLISACICVSCQSYFPRYKKQRYALPYPELLRNISI